MQSGIMTSCGVEYDVIRGVEYDVIWDGEYDVIREVEL